MFKSILAGLGLLLCSFSVSAITLSGSTNSHDPGAIITDGNTYFHFTTGTGIWYSTSTNLTTWAAGRSPVFTSYPSWIYSKIPSFGGSFWAPEAIHMNGYYYLYYSVSSFGSSVSAIGVARSASLTSPSWQDLGMVLESWGGRSEINAIDPALFRDHDGKVYMSYGSFFGGIGVAEINQSTGKLNGSVTKIYGGNHADIEAPYISRNGNYYYLFINRGACCKGASSTYYVQVARSTSITGPYTDVRTLLPNVDGKYKGPGHIGLLKQDGCNYTSIHYYDLNDNGNAKLDILKMTYNNGWPTLTRNFSVTSCGGVSDGLYRITARHSNKDLVPAARSTANGTLMQQETWNNYRAQQWYVINQGTGFYSLINAASMKSLDVYNNSTAAGANIAQWDYWGGAGQKWSLTNSSGYYAIRSQLSNLPLDVLNRSTANGAQIIQWNATGANNQQFSLTRLK